MRQAENRYEPEMNCEKCNKSMVQTDTSEEDVKKYKGGCGRSYACCITTFKCDECNIKEVVSLPAPDMDDYYD